MLHCGPFFLFLKSIYLFIFGLLGLPCSTQAVFSCGEWTDSSSSARTSHCSSLSGRRARALEHMGSGVVELGLLCPVACGSLTSAAGFLTTGPPWKSFFFLSSFLLFSYFSFHYVPPSKCFLKRPFPPLFPQLLVCHLELVSSNRLKLVSFKWDHGLKIQMPTEARNRIIHTCHSPCPMKAAELSRLWARCPRIQLEHWPLSHTESTGDANEWKWHY